MPFEHFFDVYKDLDPDRRSQVRGWGDREAARHAIADAYERHRDEQRPPTV